MQTHDDQDAPTPGALKQLQDLANRMTRAGDNVITAGKPGENPLTELRTHGLTVVRLPDDPHALRVSLGVGHDLPESAYLTFRGDPKAVKQLFWRAFKALSAFERCAGTPRPQP